MLLEPCCFRKQLSQLFHELETTRRSMAHIITFGDVPFGDILDYLLAPCAQAVVCLVLVNIEPATLAVIDRLMQAKTVDGSYKIASFTLLTQGNNRKEVVATLGHYRNEGRLFICEDTVAFRALVINDDTHHYVFHGSILQQAGYSLQLFTLSTAPSDCQDLLSLLNYRRRKKSLP